MVLVSGDKLQIECENSTISNHIRPARHASKMPPWSFACEFKDEATGEVSENGVKDLVCQ